MLIHLALPRKISGGLFRVPLRLPRSYFSKARAALMAKASRKRKTIRGIFQRISLLKTAPQFQQERSLLGIIRAHLLQGRRGPVVSRPHAPQNCATAGAPQNGHARPEMCAAGWTPA
jgi:hypothetical protein